MAHSSAMVQRLLIRIEKLEKEVCVFRGFCPCQNSTVFPYHGRLLMQKGPSRFFQREWTNWRLPPLGLRVLLGNWKD